MRGRPRVQLVFEEGGADAAPADREVAVAAQSRHQLIPLQKFACVAQSPVRPVRPEVFGKAACGSWGGGDRVYMSVRAASTRNPTHEPEVSNAPHVSAVSRMLLRVMGRGRPRVHRHACDVVARPGPGASGTWRSRFGRWDGGCRVTHSTAFRLFRPIPTIRVKNPRRLNHYQTPCLGA